MTILTDKLKRLNKDVNSAKTESSLNDLEKRANSILSEITNNPYANNKLKSNVKRHLIKIKRRINKKKRRN